MEKEFIPYEQALALKELGFDEPCLACIGENNEVIIRVGDYRSFSNKKPEDSIERDFYNNIIKDFNSYVNDTASAPLYQQAFRWFRENHNLKGHIEAVEYLDGTPDTYHWSIFNKCNSGYDQLTYEEAELECLKELIEIVKQK
jgi:hypothetical protein